MHFLKSRSGFFFLISHIISYPYRVLRRKYLFAKILKIGNLQERFTLIYSTNAWGNLESRSGYGSSMQATESIRENLPLLVDIYGINSVLDAPCGDYSWMRRVALPESLIYIGGDIVQPLVDELQLNFSDPNRKFLHLDITKDDLPKVDLMIVRDCLFHFSFDDILKFLRNFAQSDIDYLLTTTHQTKANYTFADIVTGDFRILDLTKEPFYFSNNSLFSIDEPAEGLLPPRSLKLWPKIAVLEVLENFKDSD